MMKVMLINLLSIDHLMKRGGDHGDAQAPVQRLRPRQESQPAAWRQLAVAAGSVADHGGTGRMPVLLPQRRTYLAQRPAHAADAWLLVRRAAPRVHRQPRPGACARFVHPYRLPVRRTRCAPDPHALATGRPHRRVLRRHAPAHPRRHDQGGAAALQVRCRCRPLRRRIPLAPLLRSGRTHRRLRHRPGLGLLDRDRLRHRLRQRPVRTPGDLP